MEVQNYFDRPILDNIYHLENLPSIDQSLSPVWPILCSQMSVTCGTVSIGYIEKKILIFPILFQFGSLLNLEKGVKVQLRGMELYKEIKCINKDDSYPTKVVRHSSFNWHAIHPIYIAIWYGIFFRRHGKSPLKDRQHHHDSIAGVPIMTSQLLVHEYVFTSQGARQNIVVKPMTHREAMTTISFIVSRPSSALVSNGRRSRSCHEFHRQKF